MRMIVAQISHTLCVQCAHQSFACVHDKSSAKELAKNVQYNPTKVDNGFVYDTPD